MTLEKSPYSTFFLAHSFRSRIENAEPSGHRLRILRLEFVFPIFQFSHSAAYRPELKQFPLTCGYLMR